MLESFALAKGLRSCRIHPESMATKPDNSKLLALSKERFLIAQEAESEVRKEALDDLKFRAGDQWPDEIKRQRNVDNRPCLTINQIPQFIRQITNDQRQNRPSIQINPVDSQADVDTAEVLEGMVRHIEYDSGADAAYDTAFQAAVTGGFGYFRINTAYSNPDTFEQDIKILRVLNAFTVYFDPSCKEPDYSDAMWAFVIEKLSKEDFKEQYPNAELSNMSEWTATGDGWIEKDECRVAEYFYRKSTSKTIYEMEDGSIVDEVPKGKTAKRSRQTLEYQVQWCKHNGLEVLEETDWLGKWIPIIPVLGDELDVDGERILEGIVRQAKDPQRQYNFMSSATTETIALAPKAPFVGAMGQFEGFENDWQRANIANMPYLQYVPISLNGQSAPPPQRQVANPAIEATTNAMMQSSQDLKAVTGIYQAALGAQGNETSGKGILARQQQSHGANFHFVDNLSRSLRHAGRIIVDLIPHIYDTARTMRIIGEDGTQSTVQLQPGAQQAGQTPAAPTYQQKHAVQMQAAVKKTVFDVTVGKYDVTVSTGPSYQTKRQEAVASQMQLVSSFPQIMPVAGDIMVRNMDWPGAQEIADRMQKMLPPVLQENEGQLPPQAQQQIAQLTQELQQTQQVAAKMAEEIKEKTNIKAMELESKERIHFSQLEFEKTNRIPLDYEKLRVSVVNAELAAKTQANIQQAEKEKDIILQQGEQAHEYAMQQVAAEQQQEMMQQQGEQNGEAQQSVQPSAPSNSQQGVQPSQNAASAPNVGSNGGA